MKTDVSGSTVRFRRLPEADLSALLSEHRAFVSRVAEAHHGRIVKPEGDGFWLAFPSVTAAALAAMAMQEDLRLAQPGRGEGRLAVRIVITLGDVLNQDGGLVGDVVILAARIEAITPPDEIYLSAAAWLAMNQAEVTTSFVDAFALKGFTEPVPVYRVEQRHRTHVLADRYIVITDIRGFSAIAETSPMTVVEDILDQLHEMISRVCRDFGGTHHFGAGDGQCLTFSEPGRVMAAVESLTEEWGKSTGKQRCPMNVAVHKGTLYAYRSYLFGRAMNVTMAVEIATHLLVPTDVSIFVSGPVRQDLAGTPWQDRLHRVDIAGTTSRLAEIAIYRLEKPTLEAARAI